MSYFKDQDPTLQQYIPSFDYEFLNISEWSDEKIIALREVFLVNALLVFKHIWNENYIRANINQFFVFLEQHIDSTQGRNFIERMFVYLIRSSIFEGVNVYDMVDKIEDAFQEPVLSAYDRWRLEARVEGKEEGRKEGRKEGIEEGRKEGKKEGIQEGRQEGLKEGKEQGREEQISATFKKMHDAGMELTTICEFLTISMEKAESLLRKLEQE